MIQTNITINRSKLKIIFIKTPIKDFGDNYFQNEQANRKTLKATSCSSRNNIDWPVMYNQRNGHCAHNRFLISLNKETSSLNNYSHDYSVGTNSLYCIVDLVTEEYVELVKFYRILKRQLPHFGYSWIAGPFQS